MADLNNGDKVIIFPTKAGTAALGPGESPEVGDLIAVHKTINGDLVTHGKSDITVGDKVIIVHTLDGDQVALHSGAPNPIKKCMTIAHGYGDESQPHSPPDDTYQYHATNIILSRPVYPEELLNVVLKFGPQEDTRGIQPWYPYGGVWIGISEDGNDWYWAGGNPYMTIRGQPAFHCDEHSTPLVGFKRDGGRTWCIYNFMESFYPIGQANWPVNYIHVHISQQSTLAFYNYTKTGFTSAHLCSGPVDDGWCDVLKLI